MKHLIGIPAIAAVTLGSVLWATGTTLKQEHITILLLTVVVGMGLISNLLLLRSNNDLLKEIEKMAPDPQEEFDKQIDLQRNKMLSERHIDK